MGPCKYDCGEDAGANDFLAGHDQKLRIHLENQVGGLLTLKKIVVGIENKDRLYRKCDRLAYNTKVVLQMFIGFVLVILITVKFLFNLLTRFECAWLLQFTRRLPHVGVITSIDVLRLVASALAFSAAIELAYTLFTPGPDEAVDPVIMGLASAMLLAVSQIDQINFQSGCGLVLYVIALGALFGIRQYFIKQPEKGP